METLSADAHHPYRVLIVDDDPELIDLIGLIIHKKYEDEVISAVGGREGLAKAQTYLPDLIILDIMMPDLDGYKVCAQLKATPSLHHIPILFIAAKPPKDVYPVAQKLGAAGYITEPFSPQELFAAYDAALRGETYYPLWSDEM